MTLKELQAQQIARNAAIKSDGKAMLIAAFTEFFDKFPEVRAIRWVQYAPYFNDGNPCIFRMREMGVRTVESEKAAGNPTEPIETTTYIDNDERTDCGENGETLFISVYESDDSPLMQALRGLWELIADDIAKAVFGDHVCVLATRAGFHTESYSHN